LPGIKPAERSLTLLEPDLGYTAVYLLEAVEMPRFCGLEEFVLVLMLLLFLTEFQAVVEEKLER